MNKLSVNNKAIDTFYSLIKRETSIYNKSLSVSKDNYEISFPKLAGTHDYEFNNLDSLNKKISNLKKNNGQSDVYAI